jgi:hypothetical protein
LSFFSEWASTHDHSSSEPTRLEGSLPSTSAHLTFSGITLPTNHDGGPITMAAESALPD